MTEPRGPGVGVVRATPPPSRKRAWIVGLLGVLLLTAVPLVWWLLVERESRAARRAVASGRYPDAEAAIARWLRYAPGAIEPILLKTRMAITENRLTQAVEIFRGIKASRPPGSEAELVGAILGAKIGWISEAEPILSRAFQRAREPDPLLDEALAKVYLESYDFPRAQAVIERWRQDAPDDPKPYLWRAEIDSRQSGGAAGLINDYREALQRAPKLAKARLGLAEQLRLAHRSAEASAEYAEYLLLRPDDPAGHLGASLNAVEIGDEDAATRHLERALVLDPGNAQAHKERGEIELRRGRAEAALLHLDRAVALDPYDVPIRYSRGMVLNRLGKADAARAEQVAANRLRADNDRLTALQTKLLVAPRDVVLQLQMARWMFDHGQPREGVRWAEKILKESPFHAETSRLLAGHYERLGNPGLARFYRLNADSSPSSR